MTPVFPVAILFAGRAFGRDRKPLVFDAILLGLVAAAVLLAAAAVFTLAGLTSDWYSRRECRAFGAITNHEVMTAGPFGMKQCYVKKQGVWTLSE